MGSGLKNGWGISQKGFLLEDPILSHQAEAFWFMGRQVSSVALIRLNTQAKVFWLLELGQTLAPSIRWKAIMALVIIR